MDHEKISECIEKIKDYAEDSIPVLLEDRSIGGIITAQDIVEVVDDEMGDDYAKLAGLTAEAVSYTHLAVREKSLRNHKIAACFCVSWLAYMSI